MTDNDLQLLMIEHQHASEQGRGFWVMVIAVVTVGFGALAGASLLAAKQSCAVATAPSGCVPPAVWAIVPLLPSTLTALLLQQIAVQNLNGIYERVLEREIFARTNVSANLVPGRFYVDDHGVESLPIPSFGHMIYPLFEPTGRLLSFPFVVYLTGFLFLSMALLDVAIVLLALEESANAGWQILIGTAYGLILMAFVRTAAHVTLQQPKLWRQAITGLAELRASAEPFVGPLVDRK